MHIAFLMQQSVIIFFLDVEKKNDGMNDIRSSDRDVKIRRLDGLCVYSLSKSH